MKKAFYFYRFQFVVLFISCLSHCFTFLFVFFLQIIILIKIEATNFFYSFQLLKKFVKVFLILCNKKSNLKKILTVQQ